VAALSEVQCRPVGPVLEQPDCCLRITDNPASTAIDRNTVLYVDGRGVQTFDIIVLSPPYKEISFPSLINTVCESPCLGINSLVALEYPKELGVMPSSLVSNKTGRTLYGRRNRSYGRTLLALFVHLPDREYTTKEDDFVDCGNLVTYSPPVS
jgi:16S rRNA G966 N2-methylase RsmD